MKARSRFLVAGMAACALLLCAPGGAWAANIAWDGNFSGNWADANYWDGLGLHRAPGSLGSAQDTAAVYLNPGKELIINTPAADTFALDGNLRGPAGGPTVAFYGGKVTVASGGQLVPQQTDGAAPSPIIQIGAGGQLVVDGGIVAGVAQRASGTLQGITIANAGSGLGAGLWLKSGVIGGRPPSWNSAKVGPGVFGYAMTYRGGDATAGTFDVQQDGGLMNLAGFAVAYQGTASAPVNGYYFMNGGDFGTFGGTNPLYLVANNTAVTRDVVGFGIMHMTDGNVYASNGTALNKSGGYAALMMSGGRFRAAGSLLLNSAATEDFGSRLARHADVIQTGGTMSVGNGGAGQVLGIYSNNPGAIVGGDSNYLRSDSNYVMTGGTLFVNVQRSAATHNGIIVGGDDPNNHGLLWIGGNGPSQIYSSDDLVVNAGGTLRYTLDPNDGLGKYVTPIDANGDILFKSGSVVDLELAAGYDPAAEFGDEAAAITYVLAKTSLDFTPDVAGAALLIGGAAHDGTWSELRVRTDGDKAEVYVEHYVGGFAPEPATLGLLAAGAAAFLRRRKPARR
jgi:hypothetical protein